MGIYDQQHHDQMNNREYKDRFNTSIMVAPGFNRIKIPINKIRRAPVGREMDLATIHTVMFWVGSKAWADRGATKRASNKIFISVSFEGCLQR